MSDELCLLLLLQRGGQKVSWTAVSLLLVGWTFAVVGLVLAGTKLITWLDFFYYCSYIKLAVTLTKYVPQVRSHTQMFPCGLLLVGLRALILNLSGLHELPETEHGGLEHRRRADGLQRWAVQHPADVPAVLQQRWVRCASTLTEALRVS